MSRPMVSVRLMTYNHEKYIQEAVESVLNQKCSFQVELVVGDDFSTDSTRSVLAGLSSRNNVELKVLERPEGGEYYSDRQKRGRLYNFQNIVENCTGKYVALLDGDDYWTDSTKLEAQAQYLEDNPDCNVVFHPVHKVDNDGNTLEATNTDTPRDFGISELLMGNLIHSVSVMVRIPDNFTFPEWFTSMPMGDWPFLLMTLGSKGRAHMLTKPMAAYRIHDSGVWSGERNRSGIEKRLHQNLAAVGLIFDGIDMTKEQKEQFLNRHHAIAAHLSAQLGDGKLGARKVLMKSVKASAPNLYRPFMLRALKLAGGTAG